ncbi:uncharacterized protein BX664DRAFT_300835 [Halteromyces radiatus]|uniref:uncharacterized protein n=1 Tax=Halteromyces radiatus TaxID=101107 RepID=UPI00221F6F11|nr:uncharacterized protein BX664DRAFT_300835 [Halteromyces radiatus]KAI8085104.1 hypothetical protein BX664DRAFT_300835 [Halteromyces radiatus]
MRLSSLFIASAGILCSNPFVHAETIRTKVAILGGGVAGISASLNLTLAGIDDFVLIEAREVLGGRAQDVKFGNNVTIELGCNWVQALGTNPINLLAQKYDLKTVATNYDDISYIDQDGKSVDASKEYQMYSDASDKVAEQALKRAKNNQVDITVRTALSLAGWFPKTPMEQAIEYFGYDWESGEVPELCSDIYGVLNDEANYNGNFGHNLEGDRMNIDQRGFKYIFLQEANRVFKKNDDRLKLNTKVKTIEYNKDGVTIHTDKDTIIADYAISTFSVGVLQHRDVEWKPEMPDWKMEGIFGFHLTTYTKIFMNFPKQFWADNEFTLYAHPTSRGLYSVWQNMNAKGYFPQQTKDNVFMVTVTQDNAHRVEAMTDDQVKDELMDVLRKMYGDDIPEPTDFVFPRWYSNPLFRGSYSNWPSGEMDQHHENMKAPLHNRVFFAGEAMSKDYYGYLQGGWISGEQAAKSVIQCIKQSCPKAMYYPTIVNAKIPGHIISKRELVV